MLDKLTGVVPAVCDAEAGQCCGSPSWLVSVVDDDESVRESLPCLLGELGLHARVFASAEQFLASGCIRYTRCLIVDIALPGMSGSELHRQLLLHGQCIPTIFVTGQSDKALRRGLLRQGAIECLFKPFSDEALRATLDAVLDGRVRPGPMRLSIENERDILGASANPFPLDSRSSVMAHLTPIVFIVDDDVSVRESLQSLVAEVGWRAEAFASAQEFLDRPRPNLPSCLVLDVSLPDLNGLELQQRIAGQCADMPIIFITGHGDIPMTVQAMKAGAVEFLTKPFTDHALLGAIRSALERSHAALAEASSMQSLRECYQSLSRREREVMTLVVAGLLNKQVGGELGISEITVKAHRGRVMRKMRAKSLPELVTMAARLGLPSTWGTAGLERNGTARHSEKRR